MSDVVPVKMPRSDIFQPVGGAGTGNSLARLTATEFLDLLRGGEVSALEYARACADVIDALESKVNAWAWYDRGRFESLAGEADQTQAAYRRDGGTGLAAGCLGLPVGVKDTFNTDDMPTSHGSSLFAGYTPGNDARPVTNMRRAGAIMAGKTVTAEFAVHTPNGTRNPYDLERSSGTSSSGSAVAVATGMVPVALGSQTAGSIVRPASYCGVVGFKPSYGTVPRTAMLKTTDTLDSVGWLTRSVADAALLFDTMRVKGLNYPIADAALNDPTRLKQPGRPWRLGVLHGPKSGLAAAAVQKSYEGVLAGLARSGCDLIPIHLPDEFHMAHDVHETIYRRSLAYYFRMEWESGQHEFSPGLAKMIDGGMSISFEQYQEALQRQTELARIYDGLFGNVDVVLCPSTADEAPVGLESADIPDHCLIFTMCHAPSLSLPLLRGTTGLPVGLQIASRRFSDFILLDFARFACESI